MGGRGLSAWETIEGVTVGLDDGEMGKGKVVPERMLDTSSLESREEGSDMPDGCILISCMCDLMGKSNKKWWGGCWWDIW
jgi:hypothetical protein